MNKNPFISVIVPVRNGGEYIDKCLSAILASGYEPFETIVVDDASTDDTVDKAEQSGAEIVTLDKQSGPAAARNRGAETARGEILLFIDADVVVTSNTLGQVANVFAENPNIAAVFGSYDDAPAAPDFVSQYRNLLHHYVHQIANRDAKTFWTGCGAIRKDVFDEIGGFDEVKHPTPSMEDIDIGLRMSGLGHKMILDKDMQVKHLKHWGLGSLIKTDIFQRAVPWSKLILENKTLPRDLNLRYRDRISTALLGLGILTLFTYLLGLVSGTELISNHYLLYSALLCLIVIIVLNMDLYMFFYRKRGIGFMLLAIPMHLLFYLYSGATFGVMWVSSKFQS